jgi:hypothetical protein
MKKFALLALAMLLLVPNLAHAQCTINGEDLSWYGDPFVLPSGNIPIFAGQTLSWNTMEAGGCVVLCVQVSTAPYLELGGSMVLDTETGWTYNEDFGICWELNDATEPHDGTCYYWFFDVTAPALATIGTVNTCYLITTYCNDVSGELDPVCATDTMIAYFEVVKPPVEIEIFQDTLTEVDQGVTAAYIPFQICNGDPAADPRNYTYNITSQGTVGPAIDQDGALTGVPGGDCAWVYGIIDASAAAIDDVDTLTIIGKYKAGPVKVNDTCVQAIIIVEPIAVPLFTRPVVTIMVLAMILAAAVVMKRRAKSVA